MTQQETVKFLSSPVAQYVDGAVQYAYSNLECHKSHVDEMLKTEAGRVLSTLFDQYTRETGEEFLATLEDQYHAQHQAEIDRLKDEILALKKRILVNRTPVIAETNHHRAAMQMKRDEEFIKSVSVNYIRTKEDVLTAFGVPKPITDFLDRYAVMEKSPVNVVKIEEMESEVTDYKRCESNGKTLLEKLYPEVYV